MKRVITIMLTICLVLLMVFAIPAGASPKKIKEPAVSIPIEQNSTADGLITITGWCISGPWWW